MRYVVAVAALVGSLAALPAAGQEIPEIPYTRYVLPNGLTLVVHEDHKAPIVAVNVWYHVGSKNERAGKTGFAHLFEHLMFNGSENFNDDYFKVLERIGATDLNGTTSEDRTNYFQTVPVSALDTVLWMESDRMGHLLGAVTQARRDEQRGVVKNEKRQGENEPYGRVWDLMTPSLYPKNHPYSWPVIGSMEDLDAASLDDVKEWFRTYYGAANATLVVAGDVKPEEVKAKVERYFGDVPPGQPLARYEAWVAKRTGEQRQEMRDRVPQARLYMVWNTPQWGTEDDTLLSIAGQILSSGKTSRLYKRLVYDDQIATDVSAMQGTSEIGSTFFVQASARSGGSAAPVEKAIREELARFLKGGPTQDELERARTQRLAMFIRGVERVGGHGGKSDVLAEGQVYGGDPAAYRKELAWLKAATPAKIAEAARRWLSDGLYVLTVDPFPELKTEKGIADRSKRPQPGTPPDAKLPAFERATLSNGLRVVVARRAAVPVVQLSLLVDAGYASDQGGVPGAAKLAAAMLDEGTRTRSALQISDALQRLGATLSTGANLDQTTVSLSALKANLEPSLELFADVIRSPSFPEKDFERIKKQQLAGIEQESVQPISIAMRVLPRLLFGAAHAYGNPLTGSGTVASVGSLQRKDVEAWYRAWLKPGAATLVVTGDTTLAEIAPRLERLLGGWGKGETPKKNVGPVPPPAGGVYVIDRPGAIQSLVLVGTVAPPRNNPEEIPQEVMNTILGGQFIARINMNLREDKHWSYGAGTAFIDARGPRPFIGYASVQADKTKESIQELLKEFRGIRRDRPPTAEELSTAQESLTLSLPGQWETGRAVLGSISEIVRFGFDDHYFDGWASRVRAVGLGEVSKAAQLIDPARLVWVVVGDRKKIEPGLEQLGLGKPKPIDADGNALP
ncbi:MAG TPA: pitrilysin family protein [Anaeromyxobacteraceae bacterium]|nr:pitrilysin family protein [Anaeromyxobacteraceae bacterium]